MKTIIVTSNLTYTPQNYNNVLDYVLKNSQDNIAGAVLIRISLLKIIAKIPYLYLTGCRNIASVLLGNVFDVMLRRKENLLRVYGIPFIYAENINDSDSISWIQKINPDLILNMRTRCVYRNTVLTIPRLGCVNVHHGILPQQVGLFCDLHALGDNREVGFTIHKMTSKIDRGQILHQEKNNRSNNYIKYLLGSSLREMRAIADFINKIAEQSSLPEGVLNTGTGRIVTTTPNFEEIKTLQKKGVIL
jgi:methionyl-tRNA formyltransferase